MTALDLRAVLFDLDGTLIDSTGLILESYRHTMLTHLGHVLPDALWLDGIGTPLDDQLRAMSQTEAQRQAMKATYRAHYIAHQDTRLAAFPGVVGALDALRARGLRMGVVTSKMRDTTRRALEVCGLGGYFEVVVAFEDAARHKPDPEPVQVALRGLGLEPGQVVFVGDSPFDMQAGRDAGARTMGVTWGPFARASLTPFAPERLLDRPEQLATIGLK